MKKVNIVLLVLFLVACGAEQKDSYWQIDGKQYFYYGDTVHIKYFTDTLIVHHRDSVFVHAPPEKEIWIRGCVFNDTNLDITNQFFQNMKVDRITISDCSFYSTPEDR